ncbi:LysR family transcriptional regulator [Pelagibacterium halotolerans]|uniref:Transcriptional regulatory protein n=1 Tax=Pelagibacterium halotolerans (strain DSM 22347 / JCM 15775 / CGMCC 1.7692 / B2) TaxID=1082931 RepID=G4RCB6_PELHB|nr:LysR family transcriptional regulator [Pelagibacterium halotolerans]AEQ53710.1 transcriptional regulatory protein [Pelagibacterium halotolerans B2]QJR20127.1 LysR family transcriptional regulator [Pelagibacterium halotolerans]SEA79342.1 transcriptional regulator, LysR family [Pelagibacterium halotolerans]
MVDFKGLETFVWVVSLGSFRGAAQKLNTTQPAISHRIAQLEEEIGAKLLTRETRNITPTAPGRQLLAYAEKMIAMRAEMLAALRDASAIRGVIRLGVAETIVHTWLPHFIKEVSRAYPHLSVEIEVDISPSLRSRLLAQEIDIAFLLGPLSAPLLRNRLLCEYPLGFIASPALNVPNPATVYDLAEFPLITFARKTQPYELVKSLFNRPDLPAIKLHASASMATVVHLALEGIGVAVIPYELVEAELNAGRLELIRTDIAMPQLTFCASWLESPDTLATELVVDIATRVTANRAAFTPMATPQTTPTS